MRIRVARSKEETTQLPEYTLNAIPIPIKTTTSIVKIADEDDKYCTVCRACSEELMPLRFRQN
jgi:hypothetical protein